MRRTLIEVEGVDGVRHLFHMTSGQVRNFMRRFVFDMSKKLANEIKLEPNAPSDRTGIMRKSLAGRRRNSAGADRNIIISDALFVRGKYDGFYWRFQEHGQGGVRVAWKFIDSVHRRNMVAIPQLAARSLREVTTRTAASIARRAQQSGQ